MRVKEIKGLAMLTGDSNRVTDLMTEKIDPVDTADAESRRKFLDRAGKLAATVPAAALLLAAAAKKTQAQGYLEVPQ